MIKIRDITDDPTIHQLAMIYDEYEAVEKLTAIENEQGYLVKSYINIFSFKTNCEIQFDKDWKYISSSCAGNDYDDSKICPHILATLYKLNKLSITQFPYTYVNKNKVSLSEKRNARLLEKKRKKLIEQSALSRTIINERKSKYNKAIEASFQTDKYEIEPKIVESEEGLLLEYKVGNEKKYQIKNLTDFIVRIQEKQNYRYGKNLEFIHTEDSFDELALKQIALMRIAYHHYKWINENKPAYDYSEYKLRRYVPVNSSLIDDIYRTYHQEEFDTFEFHNLNERVKLSIKGDDDVYTVHYESNDSTIVGFHAVYNYTLKDGCYIFNRIELDNEEMVSKLLDRLIIEDMVVLKEEFNDFYKYVLSPVSDYIDLSIQEDVPINQYNKIRIYGDIDEESDNLIYFQIFYIDEDGQRIPGFNKDLLTTYNQDLCELYLRKSATMVDEKKNKAYFSLDEEKTYEFINEGLNFLNDYAEVYISEELKKVGKTTHYSITVGVKLEHNLLGLDLESDYIPKDEMRDVLSHYKRKKKFYRMQNGDLLYLNSPELDELSELLNQYHVDIRDIKKGHLDLSPQRMFSLNEDADSSQYIQIDRQESFKNEIDRFFNMDKNEYTIPDKYQPILRDYQKEGYIWLRELNDYGFNGILADDMGLGKTLQVIALLEGLQSPKTSIVVCPASLIYNWEDEVHKFTDSLNVKCIVGNVTERKEIINHYNDYQLLVTSYDYMRRDYELYENIEFDYVIIDEAQNIKNQKTKNAKSVKSLQADHRLALTGTPIENSLAELWSIFDFLMPDYLFNYHHFKTQYETNIVKYQDEKKTKYLKRLVSPFILRRNKKDVLKELPEKIEKVQVIPFNEEENKLYFATLAQVNEQLQEIFKMDKIDKVEILALLTRLRQICCEPRLLYENVTHISSKLEATIDLINVFKENNEKVLLFSSFTSALDLIEEELRMQGISYYKLTGSTDKEERRKLVMQFQNDDTTVFLISLKAGGTGLNLTAASAVIHYDPWWNISAQNQATDRAYRIGQDKSVQVFLMVMKNSIEEKIIQLQQKKKELADIFVEDNNNISLSSMDKEEILELFKE